MKTAWLLLPAGLVLALGLSCSGDESSKSSFSGKAKTLKVPESPKNPVGEGLPGELDPTSTGFSLSSPTRTSVNSKEVWAVAYTDTTRIYRIKVDDEKGQPTYPTTIWNAPYSWGFRTYVTEVGLIYGTTNHGAGHALPGIWWVSDNNPGQAVQIHHAADAASGARVCVTSWRHNGQVWVGGGYSGSDGHRKFVRRSVTKNATTGQVTFGSPEVDDYGAGDWGYTCYTDQSRKYFWASFSTDVHGVNLADKTSLPASSIPNANHRNDIADFLQNPTVVGSYSMNGDDKGNLLNAGARPDSGLARHEASYAWAYDPVSKFIFGSTWNKDKFYVTDPACFSTLTSCPAGQKHFVIPGMLALGAMGPLSSLNDGRVAAWSRSSHHSPADGLSYLYFISLKDKTNPAAGLNIKKIKEIVGETYMYTDFTGATLYPADVQKTIDLSQASGFRPGVAVTAVSLKWEAESQSAEEWRGLKLQVRCYAKGAASIPAFSELTPAVAGTAFDLPACKGAIDTLDIKIEGAGDTAGFSRTKSFEVSGTQKNDGQTTPAASPTVNPTTTPTPSPTQP